MILHSREFFIGRRGNQYWLRYRWQWWRRWTPPLFRNSFPVNSHFEFYGMDEVNRYLIFNFLFLFYHLDNYSTSNAINFLIPMVYNASILMTGSVSLRHEKKWSKPGNKWERKFRVTTKSVFQFPILSHWPSFIRTILLEPLLSGRNSIRWLELSKISLFWNIKNLCSGGIFPSEKAVPLFSCLKVNTSPLKSKKI